MTRRSALIPADVKQETRMGPDREQGKAGADAKGDEKKHRLDQALDKALEDSFPGSDPVSVAQPAPTPNDKDKHIRRPKARPSTRH
jgi:hypothetical protein